MKKTELPGREIEPQAVAVDMQGLQAMLNCGRKTATDIGTKAGA